MPKTHALIRRTLDTGGEPDGGVEKSKAGAFLENG